MITTTTVNFNEIARSTAHYRCQKIRADSRGIIAPER